jgi:hypothetical protein
MMNPAPARPAVLRKFLRDDFFMDMRIDYESLLFLVCRLWFSP